MNAIIFDTGLIDKPGLYSMTSEQYHADPCAKASASHSLLKLVINRTPYHAMKHHPKMGAMPMTPSRAMTVGSTAHTLVLGKGTMLEVIDFPDYRKKEAQQFRDAALASRRVPVLAADFELAQEMVPAGRAAIEDQLGAKLSECLIEVVVIARDPISGCYRRIMVDAMTPDLRRMCDYKTTQDANPDMFARSVARFGYDTQDVFYKHVADLIDPDGIGKRDYSIIAQEVKYPDAITLHQIDNDLHAVAELKVKKALATWDACLAADQWPAYSREVNMIQAKDWQITEALTEGADV